MWIRADQSLYLLALERDGRIGEEDDEEISFKASSQLTLCRRKWLERKGANKYCIPAFN